MSHLGKPEISSLRKSQGGRNTLERRDSIGPESGFFISSVLARQDVKLAVRPAMGKPHSGYKNSFATLMTQSKYKIICSSAFYS